MKTKKNKGGSEARFTPGPWSVICQPEKNRYGFFQIEPSNIGVRIEGVNAESNARLIAAAPEMLEALKALVFHIKELKEVTVSVAMGLNQADKAIAKAEGKSI